MFTSWKSFPARFLKLDQTSEPRCKPNFDLYSPHLGKYLHMILVQSVLSRLRNQSIRPAVRRTGISLLFRMAGLAVGILTNSVLARSLGVSEFGQFGLGLTILTVITQLSDFGALQAMTAEARRSPGISKNVAGSGLCIRLLTALLGIAIAIPVGIFAIPNANVIVLVVLSACAPLGASGVLIALSNARLRPEVGSALTLGQSLLWLSSVFVVANVGTGSAVEFAIAFVVSTFLQTAITLAFYGNKSMIGRPTWDISKLIITRSWPVGLLGLLVTSYYRVGGVLVIGIAGAHEAGLFTAAYKVIDVAQIIPSLIVVPMLPVLIDALAGRGDELRRLSTAVIRLSFVMAIGSGLAISVFSSLIVGTIYGSSFDETRPVLEVLGVAFIGITMGYVGSTICFAVDRVKRQIPLVAVLGALSLGVQPWAIDNWGALGSASVAAATEIVMCIVSLSLSADTLRLRKTAIFEWRYLVLIGVLVCLFFLTRGSLLLSSAVCGAAFLGMVFLFKLIGKDEFDLILRRPV